VNGKPLDYCIKVRCKYWFRRPRHETIRKYLESLNKPDCLHPYPTVRSVVKQLVKEGKVAWRKVMKKDRLSTWGYEYFREYYWVES